MKQNLTQCWTKNLSIGSFCIHCFKACSANTSGRFWLVYSLLNWTNFKVHLTCILNSRAATYGTFQKFTENLSSIHLNFKEHVRTDPDCLTHLRFKKNTSVTIIIIIFLILPIPLFSSNFHRNIWRFDLNTYLCFPPYCYITFLACIFTTFLMFSQFQFF